MNTTVRTSAKTLLLAAGVAGLVSLSAGFSWADTLGGVTDGLPLGDLGGQVPAILTEGVGSPVGDLVSVQPGTISATPDVQHNSAPQSGSLGVVTGALDGLGLLDSVGLNTGGGTLPLSHSVQSPLSLQDTVEQVDGAVTELGAHEVGAGLTDLDSASLGEAVPVDDAVMPVNGRNTDISGGAAGIVYDLVLKESVGTRPQAAAADTLSALPEKPVAVVGDSGTSLVEGGVLAGEPIVSFVADEAASALPETDSVGGTLVGVNGLPSVGEPTVDGVPIGSLM